MFTMLRNSDQNQDDSDDDECCADCKLSKHFKH